MYYRRAIRALCKYLKIRLRVYSFWNSGFRCCQDPSFWGLDYYACWFCQNHWCQDSDCHAGFVAAPIVMGSWRHMFKPQAHYAKPKPNPLTLKFKIPSVLQPSASPSCKKSDEWEFPKTRGTFLGGPHSKNPTI